MPDPPRPTPSRDALLSWLANVAPDLRIRVGKIPDSDDAPTDGQGRKRIQTFDYPGPGRRVIFARFTLDGRVHEVAAEGDDPDEEIAVVAVDAARATIGWPPMASMGQPDPRSELEQQIVLAALAGDTEHCEWLTRQLVSGAAPRARALAAKTGFERKDQYK